MGTTSTRRNPSRRTKVMALAAAGIVLLAGVGVTSMAFWQDKEFVTGGVNGIASSTFDVEQNVNPVATTTGWTTNLASPGGTVNFGALATKLTPNDSVYGGVRLRTVTGSLPAAAVTLNSLVPGTGLGQYLTYGARLLTTGTDCSSATYAAGTLLTATDADPVTANGANPFTLVGNGGSTVGAERTVCFKISMLGTTPTTAQNTNVTAIWRFDANS
jgi:hypothetical protein